MSHPTEVRVPLCRVSRCMIAIPRYLLLRWRNVSPNGAPSSTEDDFILGTR